MPVRPKRPCSHPRCPNLTSERYCDAHVEQNKLHGDQRTTTQKGYDKSWEKVRERSLKRSHYLCEVCLKEGLVTIATQVHHIKKIRDRPDLRLALDNLVNCCVPCHKKIEGKDYTR